METEDWHLRLQSNTTWPGPVSTPDRSRQESSPPPCWGHLSLERLEEKVSSYSTSLKIRDFREMQEWYTSHIPMLDYFSVIKNHICFLEFSGRSMRAVATKQPVFFGPLSLLQPLRTLLQGCSAALQRGVELSWVKATSLAGMPLSQQWGSLLPTGPTVPFLFSHRTLWRDTLSLGKQLREVIQFANNLEKKNKINLKKKKRERLFFSWISFPTCCIAQTTWAPVVAWAKSGKH